MAKIHEGKLDAFKGWAQKCIQNVKEKDTETLEYDWYFIDADLACVVRETYANSNAVLAHMENLGDLLAQGAEMSDLSLEVYGNPSEELAAAAAWFQPAVYTFFQGI